MTTETMPSGDLGPSFQLRPSRLQMMLGGAIAAAAYGIALVATLPAALVLAPPATISVAGTAWNGVATLPGGNEITWNASVWRSLAGFSWAVNWALSGPGNALTGRATLGFGGITIDDASGRAGLPLVTAFVPELSSQCDAEARVDIRHFSWGAHAMDAAGEIRSDAASCPDGQIVPPLVATLTSDKGVVTARASTLAAPSTLLGTASLDATGKLIAEILPEAASIIPGLPKSAGPFRIETTLSLP